MYFATTHSSLGFKLNLKPLTIEVVVFFAMLWLWCGVGIITFVRSHSTTLSTPFPHQRLSPSIISSSEGKGEKDLALFTLWVWRMSSSWSVHHSSQHEKVGWQRDCSEVGTHHWRANSSQSDWLLLLLSSSSLLGKGHITTIWIESHDPLSSTSWSLTTPTTTMLFLNHYYNTCESREDKRL